MKKHTPKYRAAQAVLIDFFQAYQAEHGQPPTLREVGKALGSGSTSYIKYTLDALVRDGVITYTPGVARGYSVPQMRNPALIRLPIRQIDLKTLRRTYHQACIAAGIDPETGPQTRYQSVVAIAEARKRRRIAPATMRWWQVDYADPGTCRSDVEYEAFFNLFVAAWERRHGRRRE